jgi:hypothetical protein
LNQKDAVPEDEVVDLADAAADLDQEDGVLGLGPEDGVADLDPEGAVVGRGLAGVEDAALDLDTVDTESEHHSERCLRNQRQVCTD